MKTGRIVIISGPSGTGKTTLQEKLLLSKKLKGKLVKSISVTTRPKRAGEKDGRDYLFISEKNFLFKRRSGHLLESQRVFCHYYGTPQKAVNDLLKEGKHVLLCIDVKGAKVVWCRCPEALKIFITPPSLKVLKERLVTRATESSAAIQIRLAVARKELKEAKYYDYVLVNDHLKRAYQTLEDIIYNELILH